MKISGNRFKKAAASLSWPAAGVLSWWLYTFVLAQLFLPVIHRFAGAVYPAGSPAGSVPAGTVLMQHLPEYGFCFLLCLLLGCFSKVTLLRAAAFICSAGAVPVYYQVLQLYGYYRYYGDMQSPAPELISVGLVSSLVIAPGFALLGIAAGYAVRRYVVRQA